jgi:hypothetical protein
MTELSPEAKRFVEEVRELDDPSRADEARIRGALAAAIAAQGATIASGTATAAAASGTGAVALKLTLAGALVVGVASTVVYTVMPEPPDEVSTQHTRVEQPQAVIDHGTPRELLEPDPAPEPALEPALEPETPMETPRAIAPAPRAIAIEPPTTPEVAPSETAAPIAPEEPPTPADTLAEELDLIRAANRALAADPPTALARLDEHRARFERGQLATDREVVRVLALCALGRTIEAHAIGDALRARLAGTTRGQRLDRSCIGGESP